jgi:hypothetical protein
VWSYFVPRLASLWQVQAVRAATDPNNSRHPAQVGPPARAEIPQNLTRRRGDLVIGSGLEFEDRGVHELKGVPGEWHLFAVTST